MHGDDDLGIHGAHRIDLRAHPDERGSFTEAYRRAWLPEMREMVQGNLSRSRANVLRGLHFHRRQTDYWLLVEGVYHVGLFDLRRGSPTEGAGALIRLGAEDRATLFLPPGVAHGFYAETDLTLLYLVDEYYTGEDEFGVAWDDPGLGIAWPSSDPILSERDRTNPSLEEALRDPPTFGG